MGPKWKGYPELTSVTSNKGTARVDGIPNHYYNRSGQITVWNIYRLFLMFGIRVVYTREFDLLKAAIKKAFFTLVTDLTIFKECYDYINISMPSSLKFDIEIINCGRSSIVIKKIITDEKSSTELARIMIKFIVFDLEIGKSTPLPDWFINKYKRNASQDLDIDDVTLHGIPTNTYKMDMTVRSSDLDENNHTGTADYVSFCCDCATMAMREKYYDGFCGNFVDYVIERVNSLHKEQSFLGDILLVQTWQEKDLTSKLHFVILKKNNIQHENIFFLEYSFLKYPKEIKNMKLVDFSLIFKSYY
ncbi:hypothetical protein KUTeg_011125 [Tegillarca granosa]|uniref:Uncharacterized protein n=1 Tax=Tegillarca granosa TaxID=220873 RepID=A0ABQ9F679_TEGGR|nr:hypothetical protein KUTeg_011125 [Tegillarca granosa]